jgi:hypothetical protein
MRETRETLEHTSRWLWFKPHVIPALLQHRGGGLAWYTHDTGAVGCSPGDRVHFGVNKIGLVNVFAKDIVQLPDWQQRIWAGHNVAPESGVSEELLASQMAAKPARTTAPERRLRDALERLNDEVRNALDAPLFREHEKTNAILRDTHRFRALDEPGLFGLAKDLARLTADRIDAAMLQKVKPPPMGKPWGSLKSLENVLATVIPAETAYSLVGPLFGILELRHADAHLPASTLRDFLVLAGVDPAKRVLEQGLQLVESCATALNAISAEIPKLRRT